MLWRLKADRFTDCFNLWLQKNVYLSAMIRPLILLFLGALWFPLSSAHAQLILHSESRPSGLALYTQQPDQPFLTLPAGTFLRVNRHTRKIKGKLGSYTVKDKVQTTAEYSFSELSLKPTTRTNQITYRGAAPFTKDKECQLILSFRAVSADVMEFRIRAIGGGVTQIEFPFPTPADQPAFGFGEQFSYLDRKGHEFWMLVEEQGVGRGDPGVTFWAKMVGAAGNPYTTYCPIPFFFLDANRAVSLDPSGPLHFDLRDSAQVWVRSSSNELSGRIYLGDGPLKVLERYTQDAGRFPALPEWAFGTWIGVQGGAEKARKVVDEALAAGNPVTGLWIQDWVGPRETPIGTRLNWDWFPDTTRYPDLKGFCAEMNEKGVKVLGYINPFLVEDGILCKQAMELDYLVRNQEGEPYRLKAGGFNAYILDLSRAEVQEWTAEIIRENLVGNGFSGWMADFGEWLPFDAQLEGGLDAATFHNTFPVAWMETNQKAIDALPNGDELVYFSRSGYIGAGKAGKLLWAGDQMTDWGQQDGLPSAVRGLLSSGMSGLTLNHTDLGGYTVVQLPFTHHTRDRELLYRWAEFAAFTPVFRTHEGLRPDANLQVYSDPEAIAFFAKMGQMHHALSDYLESLNQEAVSTGAPMVRHLWLTYPEDTHTRNIDHSFMLGNEVLVHPVLQPGVTQIERYFPTGEWIHLLSGKKINGGSFHTIEVPMGSPAVFGRKGSIWTPELTKKLAEIGK